MRFIHDVSGLIQQESTVVRDGKLNVGAAFLRKARGKAVTGERYAFGPHRECFAEFRSLVGVVQTDAGGSSQQIFAARSQGLGSSVLIDTGLIRVRVVAP